MGDTTYVVTFSEPHDLTDGDETELAVTDYEDFGSMYQLSLTDGSTRSVGKQLVSTITEQD
jgi:hypothetical protein